MTRYRAAEVATLSFLRGTLNQQRTRPRRVTLLRSGVVIHEQPALFLGHALAPFHVRCDERMLAYGELTFANRPAHHILIRIDEI